MKLRSQIVLAQVPTLIIIVFITIFFIFALTTIEHESDAILEDNVKCIISMEKINDSIEELNNHALFNPKSIDGDAKKMENKIEEELLLKEKITTEPGEEKQLVQSLREKWELYQTSVNSLFPSDKIEETYKDLKKITADIIGLNQDELIRKKNDLSNFIVEYRLFISVSAIASLVFGFFMAWIFIGLALSPLNKMIEIVSQFGKTDETSLLNIKGSEEIEKLSNEFNLMTNRLEEYHQSTIGHIIEDYESLKGAFDALPDPVLLFNHNYDIIFMNRAAERLFGISGKIKKRTPLVYLENSLRESLIKTAKKAFLIKKPTRHNIPEDPIPLLIKNKKKLFLPFVYAIKNPHNINPRKVANVFIVLQDPTRQSLSEKEAAEVFRNFIHDFQEPLMEIQLALFAMIQEEIGHLTEKQKELIFLARDKCDELERVYQEFRKISEIGQKTSEIS